MELTSKIELTQKELKLVAKALETERLRTKEAFKHSDEIADIETAKIVDVLIKVKWEIDVHN